MLALHDVGFAVLLPFGENAVYCPDTSGVYLVPIDDLAVERQGALRVEAPRNNQKRFIRFASDYEVARVDLRSKMPALPDERLFDQAFSSAATAT
jgi:hypothetical protein